MATADAGKFTAHWDRTTGTSTSITTDWSYSGSVSYFVVSVDVAASEHKQISEDFKNTTSVDLGAKAAFKAAIAYPGWFRSNLFRHKRVKENLREFEDFFGPKGTLRYYPTHLIMVRGFTAAFENSQKWTYDYDRKFQASVGGGFSVAGIRFGSKATYGSHVTEHSIDQSNTSLKFSDGEGTLRFVGYVVKKNTLWDSVVRFSPIDELGNAIESVGYKFH
ncbi:MAG: hypothetical protein JSS49_08555 [Planctomycetes bacterium]|nr:hypothetical protein [Planctomycetota bacterium]